MPHNDNEQRSYVEYAQTIYTLEKSMKPDINHIEMKLADQELDCLKIR